MTISKVRKTERLKLLFLQKQIEEKVCAVCPHYNIPTQKVCEGCHSFEELNNIGNWLLTDTAHSRGGKKEEISPVKHQKLAIMTPFMLSVNEYMGLRESGLNDSKIALKLNVTFSSFKKWKIEAGLVKTKEMRGSK